MTRNSELIKLALVGLMVITFIYSSYFIPRTEYKVPGTDGYLFFPEVKENANPWYERVVKPGEYSATKWIAANTEKSDKFIADIFGAELIMGMTTRVSSVGGDWANAPNPVKLMGDTNTIYKTGDPAYAHSLATELNATYVWAPNRYTFSGYGWEQGDYYKFSDPLYFEQVYQNEDVTVYRVLK